MLEVVVTTGAKRRAKKLQSNRHHQQTNTQFFTRWTSFLLPDQQCPSAEGTVQLSHLNNLKQSFFGRPSLTWSSVWKNMMFKQKPKRMILCVLLVTAC